MSSPKPPKVAAVAAPAKQSALSIKRTQNDAREALLKRRGVAQSEFAGETGGIGGGVSALE